MPRSKLSKLDAQIADGASQHVFDYVAGADVLHVEVLHKGLSNDVLIGDAWVPALPPIRNVILAACGVQMFGSSL